jgi:anaerobic magnesium-protoporphyrin IX monomethyl ester cyclase
MKHLKSQVDIVLATPPSSKKKEFGALSSAGANRPPLNLLNIAAVLLEKGYSVQIVDGVSMPGGIRELTEMIVDLNPRFIGLTAMTAHIHECGKLADALRIQHHAPIIVGGIHVSTLPVETMSNFRSFDIGVVGEGESTCVELIECLDKGKDYSNIDGLVIRTENGIRLTAPRKVIENLDVLPLPAWHLLPDYVQTYQPTLSRKTRLPSAYIVTSRGCPHACSFCCNTVHGNTFRSYSVDYLMKMVAHMVDVYSVKDLTIYDENLALNKKRISEFCKRLIDAKYDLTWSCDARADSIDDELLDLMSKAGCRSIWYGMESGNEEILKKYNKKISLKALEKASALTRKHNIKACGSFIIGGPSETKKTIKDTIRFVKKLKLDYFVPFYYTPIPGAPDYDNIAECGTVDLDYRSATMTQPTFAPHGMTFSDINYWYVRAMLSFYLQPRILLRFVNDMGLQNVIKSGLSFLINTLRYRQSER